MQKGFSLIELIVTVAIITILSAIGLTSYFTIQRQSRLESDAILVSSAIRRAQNRALSPSRSEFNIPATDQICSMGVEFIAPNRIRPFASSSIATSSCGSPSEVKRFLPGASGDIRLASSRFNNTIELRFTPPFAVNQSGITDLQISTPDNSLSKTITVTDAGLIKIE